MKVLATVATLLVNYSNAVTANWALCISEDCNTGYKCCASSPPSGSSTSTMVCVDQALSSKVIPSGTYTAYTYTCGSSVIVTPTKTTVATTPTGASTLVSTSAMAASVLAAYIIA